MTCVTGWTQGGWVIGGASGDGGGAIGSMPVIETFADLEAHTTLVGTTYTLDKPVRWNQNPAFDGIDPKTAMIRLPAGHDLVFGPNGVVEGIGRLQGGVIGDHDGPLVSGPAAARFWTIWNESAGASAECVQLNGSRTFSFRQIALLGARGGTLSNITGAAEVVDILLSATIRGLVVDAIIAVCSVEAVKAVGSIPGWIGINVLDTATITGELAFHACAFGGIDPSAFGIRIGTGVTIGESIKIVGCTASGGKLLDSVGGRGSDDPKVEVRASVPTPESSVYGGWLYDGGTADPVVIPFLAAGQGVTVDMRADGVSNSATQFATLERITFAAPGAPAVPKLTYTGESARNVIVQFELLMRNTGATSDVTGWITLNATDQPIPDSTRPLPLTSTYAEFTITGEVTVQPGDVLWPQFVHNDAPVKNGEIAAAKVTIIRR